MFSAVSSLQMSPASFKMLGTAASLEMSTVSLQMSTASSSQMSYTVSSSEMCCIGSPQGARRTQSEGQCPGGGDCESPRELAWCGAWRWLITAWAELMLGHPPGWTCASEAKGHDSERFLQWESASRFRYALSSEVGKYKKIEIDKFMKSPP